jgi:hypothetical protein
MWNGHVWRISDSGSLSFEVIPHNDETIHVHNDVHWHGSDYSSIRYYDILNYPMSDEEKQGGGIHFKNPKGTLCTGRNR